MRKKLLTLEDLVLFCSKNKMQKFSAEESGYQICVQVPSVYAKDEEQLNDSLLMGTVKLLHTNRNRNGSNVTKKAAENCMSSIQYKPLLANFTELENGDMDFTSHDMEINDDGSINYLEHQIGCFTSDKPYMEYDEEKDRYYIYAKVAIPREYTAAAEIIERKGGTKISAEIAVNSMSYDAKEKELLLEDIEIMGATCLGTNPETGVEVQEGMEGARLDIVDFSTENNSVKFEQNDKLIELLESLNNKLDSFNIQANAENSKEGGNQTMFEELLEKYGKTVEDITFEYENLTDEELEVAFAEAFAEAEGDNGDGAEPEAPASEEPEADPEPTEDETAEEEDPQEDEVKSEFSITINGETKTFSLSLNDKLNALYSLVNETYGEQDNDWYDVVVFEDEKRVEMHGFWSGKHFRQSFNSKKDNYSLTGDRVEIYAKFMTQDEINAFEKMKADFAELQPKFEEVSTKLEKYESEPAKMEILESTDYNNIAEVEEFIELKKQENHFDLTIEEVTVKADEMLLAYAKNQKIEFAATETNEPKEVGMKKLPIGNNSTKRSRYGGLGKKED